MKVAERGILEVEYSASKAVVSRLIADETLVVPIRNGVGDLASIYTFNRAGTLLWDQFSSGKKSVRTLVDAVTAEYQVSPEQAFQDTISFIEELEKEGLLARV
ncbi:MAG TPA: PqqD family protein [Terriglobales bacterium]|nr:PqqD family protein [Terriglobales bacterium]